jgi:holo-[acyl-carrier protein] synthase
MSATAAVERGGALIATSIRNAALRNAAPGAMPADGTIVGIGVDAVDVARFRRILARHPGFAGRFFTGTEQADARRAPDPTESLAARFAAKEAVMKALGTGLGGFALTEVEVQRGAGPGATAGAPSLVLYGAAAALAAHRGAGRFHLSLTHTAEVAVAFVVAERSIACSPS